jgi:site-specific recombinase XerD
MPDRFVLNDFVVKLRENGMSPLNWKPKTWTEFRMHALIYTLIDTGARIDVELLNLKRQDILIDDLLIKLSGKGSKQRMAQCPLSFAKS